MIARIGSETLKCFMLCVESYRVENHVTLQYPCPDYSPRRGLHEPCMKHPELLRTNVHKSRGAGAKHPAGVRGVPEILLFLLLRVAGGDVRGEKERCGDTPHPGLGQPPFAIPLLKGLERYRTSVRKVRDDSCKSFAKREALRSQDRQRKRYINPCKYPKT